MWKKSQGVGEPQGKRKQEWKKTREGKEPQGK
jgi:hypothetical protein